jgi:ParB family chromosome partitioning protein
VAGAIVTIDRNGEAVIHRGLMREAEAKALRTLDKDSAAVSAAKAKPRTTTKARTPTTGSPRPRAMSDRLAQKLSAHRTAALQIEVARHPQVALAAAGAWHGANRFAARRHYGDGLPLGVRLTSARPAGRHGPRTGPNRPPQWRCANCNR